jgi:hypothetical protein
MDDLEGADVHQTSVFHDFRALINDQMAALGVPTELRSRTLHHTGDLQQLANTVYSALGCAPLRFGKRA